MTVNKIQELKRILNNMDPSDENVIAAKALLESIVSETNLYMLYYKGQPLHFRVDANGDDAEFCNSTRVALTTDDYEPIWTTSDIRVAAYVKYQSTEWYNSSIDSPEHKYKPEELEIIDSLGNVYDRKPLTIKTKAIIYGKLFGDDYLLKEIERRPEVADMPLSHYEQTYFLEEVKEKVLRRKGKAKLSNMNLGNLYDYRKELVITKGELVKAGKPYDKIQKKLDSVNKKIVRLGGR